MFARCHDVELPMTIDVVDLPRARRLNQGEPTSMSSSRLGSSCWRAGWSTPALALLLAFAAPVEAAEPAAAAAVTQPSNTQPSAAQKETARTWLRRLIASS